MIAKLWAQQIMLLNKKFLEVPIQLRNSVRSILIDRGFEGLINE